MQAMEESKEESKVQVSGKEEINPNDEEEKEKVESEEETGEENDLSDGTEVGNTTWKELK